MTGPRTGPKRTPEELRESYLAAYRYRCDGLFYSQIAAKMAGTPHWCGGTSTAHDWVKMGRAIAVGEDGNRGRRARREMAADAIDALRVIVAEEAKVGLLDRAKARDLQLRAIMAQVQLLGLRAAPEPARVKLTGSGARTLPADVAAVLEQIAAIPLDEFSSPTERPNQ